MTDTIEYCTTCGKVKSIFAVNLMANAAAPVPTFCYPNITNNASDMASLIVPPLASASSYVPVVYDMCICR